MRNKKILFISILIFMVVLSIGAVSAQDADDAIASNGDDIVLGDSESVSGGVDVVTENPWTTTGELSYDIPSDAKTIKSADVYVNVYAGSANNNYGANANITIATANGNTEHDEFLWITEGTTDGTVYTVNDHTTKCYSDYMIHYDITSMLNGLNGTNLKINVDTLEMEGKQFDGRIKLIALILAYDDDSDDSISYWINDDQLWTKSNYKIAFDTEVTEFTGATLRNVVLSSGDGTYILNDDDFLGDADTHVSGNYYQYNEWDVTGIIKANQSNDLNVLYAGTSSWGSIKNALSVLTISNIMPLEAEIIATPEYTSVPSAYAGTNNTLTINVNAQKAGKYTIKLLADGVKVNATDVALVEGINSILLTDPTIRDVDASTVNGAENNLVDYTVELYYKDAPVNSTEISLPVLYNGNLGHDLEYNITGFEEIAPITINGDFVIDVKDVSSYLGSSAMNRTDNWAINLNNDSKITNAFIYVPYNWFNAKTYTEDMNMFTATFNGATVTPIAWYRDQGNLGNYGKYGYGVLTYDVTDLIAVGDNSFVLNKVNPTPAVYPSALVYMYNTTGSTASKTVYILNGADLLASSNNNAGRIVESDTEMTLDYNVTESATLYVLAASAQAGESDIVFNGEVYSNVWSGTSSTTDLFSTDVTSLIEDNNSISFVATGSTILELSQFIVTSNIVTEISITPEYTSVPSAYAGTNNTLTVKIKTTAGNYEVKLLADGVEVNSTEVTFVKGENTILLTDPTIRDVDASTANGAENNVVNYTVEVSSDGVVVDTKEVYLPVLYNGNLGHDLEYNMAGFEEIAPITINGDVVIDVKDVSSYLGASAMNRTDNWAISLDANSKITNAFIYVPYNWFNAKTYTEDMNMFTATFNGATVTPIAWYRDQGNLGNYGKYGYGVLIYDVTDLIAVGDNSFVLNKVNPTPAVYPSALVYMYNTTGSYISKTVYILNGADLLSNSNNNAGRIVESDTEITFGAIDIDNATLYVLAASAQAGESDILFNGNVYSDVWSGTSSTTDLFTTDVTGLISNSNSISFVATGSTILELSQIIVTYKDTRQTPVLSAENVVAICNTSSNAIVTLKDNEGNPVSGVKVKVVVGDLSKIARTDANGQVFLDISSLVPGEYKISARSAATDIYKEAKAYAKATIKDKITPTLIIPNVVTVYNTSSVVVATLNDDDGNAVSGVKVKVVVGDLSKIARTDANGQVFLDISGLTPGEYKIAARSAITDIYNEAKSTAKAYVSADKVNNTLTIPNIEIQYGTTGAVVVATLKDAYGNAVSGVKVKVVVGDFSKISRTDANGQVSLDISGLMPAEYKVSARSAITDIYNEAKTTAKLIVNKIDTTLTIPDVVVVGNSTGVVVATLKDSCGNIISGVKVKVVVGSLSKIAKTDANGQVSLDISSLAPGIYKVSARSAITDIYNEAKTTAKAIISEEKLNTTLTIPNVETQQGATGAVVVATLKDSYGNIVSGVKVKVVVGDLSKIAKTDVKGQVSLDISSLEAGEYKISARSAVTDMYNEAKTTAKVIVRAD